jgi:hypothetical protein
MSPAELKKSIVTSLHKLLSPQAFRKSGSIFLRLSNDVVQLIEVQSSRHNSAESARYTVNVGVFLLPLVDEDMLEFTKPSVAGAHWRERIGFLSSEKRDLWWSVATSDQADVAAKEIASLVGTKALPALASLDSSQALIALWREGISPGITEYQRKNFLERLEPGLISLAEPPADEAGT